MKGKVATSLFLLSVFAAGIMGCGEDKDMVVADSGHKADTTDTPGIIEEPTGKVKEEVPFAGQEFQNVQLKGHMGGVYVVSFSPDGRLLASAGYDDAINLWDVQNKRLIAILEHKGIPFSFAFSPDGKLLAVGDMEHGAASLWDVQSKERIATLQVPLGGSAGRYNAPVAFSPDGKVVAYVGRDWRSWDVVQLWDIEQDKNIEDDFEDDENLPLGQILHPNSIAFSPDGSLLAAGGWMYDPISQRHIGAVGLWDMQNKRIRTAFRLRPGHVDFVAFSPDSRLLAYLFFDSETWNIVRLWDVKQGKSIEDNFEDDENFHVNCIAFSPDGKLLAAGGWLYNPIGDRDISAIRLRDVQSKRLVATLQRHEARHRSNVNSVAFSPDGSLLAAGESGPLDNFDDVDTVNVVTLWDLSGLDKKSSGPGKAVVPTAKLAITQGALK